VGEDVSGQNKAKTRIGKYQRAWGSSAVLWVALATALALGRGGFSGGGGSWQRARDGEGQRGGLAFIGGRLWRERKGSKAGSALSIRAPVAFHWSHAIDGQRKGKGASGKKGKEEDGADGRGQVAAGERRVRA